MKNLFINKIKKSWLQIILFVLAMVSLTMIVSLLMPKDYSSKVQALIIQKQGDIDSYTAQKSAEKIGRSFAVIMQTTSFLDLVAYEGTVNLYEITSLPEKERREIWKKTISANVIPETGIIEVEAFDSDPEKSRQIATSATNILVERANDYYGGGENIEVKIVNKAVTSSFPVRPNIFLNLLIAFVLSLAMSFAYFYFEDELNSLFKTFNKTSQINQKENKKKDKLYRLEKNIEDFLEEETEIKTMPEEFMPQLETEEVQVNYSYSVLDPKEFYKQ